MRAVIRAFTSAVLRGPWVVVAAFLAITALLGPLAGQIEVAQGNEGFAPDNPELRASERIGELFGSDSQEQVLQIVVRSDDGDVIDRETLQLVADIRTAITQVAGDSLSTRADRPPIVTFLAPVEAAAAQGVPVTDDAAVDGIFAQAVASGSPDVSFVTGLLAEGSDPASARASAGLILVFLEPPAADDAAQGFDAQIALEEDIAEAVASVPTPDGVEVRPFSFTLLFSGTDDFDQEVGRLFALAALIILVILAFVFWLRPTGSGWLGSVRRTAADVSLTLVTIFAAITWMQGIGVLLERAGLIGSFNPVTQIIPVLLIGLGVDYGIHVTSRYREEIGEGATVTEAIGRSIGTVGIALALATLTTAVGFLTNAFNPVPALKDFGILSSIGIAVSFLLMLTFVPAVRLLLDRRAERAGRLPRLAMAATGDRLLPRLMERVSILAERVPVATLAVAVGLGLLGWWGFSRLETRFSVTDFLPEDSPYVQTLEIIQDDFGGGFAETTQVLVEAEPGTDLASAEVHNALVEANRALTGIDAVVTLDTPVGPVPSAESPISVLQGLFAAGPESAPPEVLQAAAAAGLQPDLTVTGSAAPLWEAMTSAAPEQAARVVHRADDGRFDAVLFSIQTQAGEQGASQLRQDLLEVFSTVEELPGVSVVPTSQNIISAVIVEELAASQTVSLMITLVVATLILVVSFFIENRRPFLGVITILPVVMVVFWTYGLMYATGIPFGPVTATLAALAIGIGVPFTIHITRRFEEDRQRFESLEDALRSTTRHTGGALAGSAFTTMAGFGILVTSSLVPFQQMGQVTFYAVGLSLIGAVAVLPSLLALWESWHRRRAGEKSEELAAV
ncbi:MAG: MFS transporter [Acidimicrobiia bacterium]|nr:MAG: MFS transporter [Acidimicrobiia bacterium]